MPAPDTQALPESTLVARPDDRLSASKSLLLGLQHVLAMDVYVVPFIIGTIVALSVTESAGLIQATFLAAGLATLIQSQWWMRLPIAQGASYVPIGAVAGIALAAGGGASGMAAVYGAMLPGAVVLVVLGLTPVFRRAIRWLVPPIVGGTIIVVVGLALIPIGLNANVFALHPGAGTLQQNVALAGLSAGLLVALVTLGLRLGRHGVWLRLCSVLLALAGGWMLASAWGLVDASAVAAAPWFTLPQLAFLDFKPSFSAPAVVTMLVIYAVLMAETTGTWFAVSAAIAQPLRDEQIDRGVVGEGLGCLVSALVGSTPVTGYSTNAGIISLTGIASRHAFLGAGLWLILFGLSGKLAATIASIPAPVIGGVFMVVCAVIALSGLRVIRHVRLNERNMFVIGMPIVVALFIDLAPPELMQSLPQTLQYLLNSSIAAGAVVAVLLHQLLPEVADE